MNTTDTDHSEPVGPVDQPANGPAEADAPVTGIEPAAGEARRVHAVIERPSRPDPSRWPARPGEPKVSIWIWAPGAAGPATLRATSTYISETEHETLVEQFCDLCDEPVVRGGCGCVPLPPRPRRPHNPEARLAARGCCE